MPVLFEVIELVFFVLIRARGLLGAGPWRLVFPCAAGAGSESNAVREETQGDHAAEDLQHPAGDHAGQRRGGEAQLCEKCLFFLKIPLPPDKQPFCLSPGSFSTTSSLALLTSWSTGAWEEPPYPWASPSPSPVTRANWIR